MNEWLLKLVFRVVGWMGWIVLGFGIVVDYCLGGRWVFIETLIILYTRGSLGSSS